MKYIKQLTIILILSFISEFLGAVIPLPIPACVYGIILLFALLETKIIPLDAIEETGRFLVTVMPIMFIPPAIRLIELWDVLKPIWLICLFIVIVTTFLVMLVSGKVTEGVLRLSSRKENKKDV
ncbi:MAG: CidA/LrgA family protein [Clostridia bacterium]|nr:CidA/LrgA family protein [Clostridia bacterium]